MSNSQFKIVLVGSGSVGKTTYLNRLLTGEFIRNYVATLGVEVHPLSFYTNNENYPTISFTVWDCAGQNKFQGLKDGYYVNADGMIAMFDVTSKHSFSEIVESDCWTSVFLQNIPHILVGNKVDVKERKVSARKISRHLLNPAAADWVKKVKYFDVSARSNYNFEKPWLELARKLTGDQNLVFTHGPSIVPPEIVLPSLLRAPLTPLVTKQMLDDVESHLNS